MIFLGAWFRRRQVERASLGVVAGTVVVLAACGWRLTSDGTSVAVAELAGGHRYLLVPIALVAAVAAALAGSIASADASNGAAAVLAATSPSVARGLLAQVVAAGAGAAAWAAVTSAAVAASSIGLVLAVGTGPGVALGDVGAIAAMVGRGVASAGGLGCLAAALGLALPGSSVPAATSSLGVLVGELALLVLGALPSELLGSAYALALVGAPQAALGGLSAEAARWALLGLTVAPFVAALLIGVLVARFRPPPS